LAENKKNKFNPFSTIFGSYCIDQLPNVVLFLIAIFNIWCTLNSLILKFKGCGNNESNSILKEQLHAMQDDKAFS